MAVTARPWTLARTWKRRAGTGEALSARGRYNQSIGLMKRTVIRRAENGVSAKWRAEREFLLLVIMRVAGRYGPGVGSARCLLDKVLHRGRS
ncbi:hypothetical protein C5L14_27065 [Labrys okinawensis]|uniref:Uncharacterized protein n=1 Tax=Labrys okinawensis TaxID=346911 RepID=A0A2S9Q5B0_9HYPH|nr:hypothetical protein C5L14_27065 [Labrys okinawensis]